MPAPQTAVLTTPPIALAGELADSFTMEDGDVRTAIAEEPGIVPGTMVGMGAGMDGVLLLAAQSDPLAGVATLVFHDPATASAPSTNSDVPGYAEGVTFGRVRKGRVAVFIETDVDVGDEVHVRVLADPMADEIAGAFGHTDGNADTIKLPPEMAAWVIGGSAGGVAILDLDLPPLAVGTSDT